VGTAVSPDDRPLRADARRNRALLLEAAEAVFAARGVSASTEEVARTAGVGVGTLFRHFPTKEALLEAVFRERLQRMAEGLRDLGAADDLGTAFFDFLSDAVAHSATKVALADALAEAGIDAVVSAREKHDLGGAVMHTTVSGGTLPPESPCKGDYPLYTTPRVPATRKSPPAGCSLLCRTQRQTAGRHWIWEILTWQTDSLSAMRGRNGSA